MPEIIITSRKLLLISTAREVSWLTEDADEEDELGVALRTDFGVRRRSAPFDSFGGNSIEIGASTYNATF